MPAATVCELKKRALGGIQVESSDPELVGAARGEPLPGGTGSRLRQDLGGVRAPPPVYLIA